MNSAMDLSRGNGSVVNTSDTPGDISGTFQNFAFHDILPSGLFLPDINPGGGLDYEDASSVNIRPGSGVPNQDGIACNGSTICSGLLNSTLFTVAPPGDVVESSTRRFTSSDLWEENDYFALLNIPAMVFIGVLMIFGIVGNTLVVYVYGFRFKPTTQHFLIVCLACLDLLMACIAMPTDIADLRFHHTFSSLAACKLLRFITMFSSTSSSFTLVTIAWDRHKRVTRPLTRQMTLKDAKVWEFINLIAALLFSWPLLVMTGLRTSETRVPGLFGTDCSFSDTFHGTRWPLLYNSILGLGFAIMIAVLGTLYFQVWKRAKRHRIYMAKRLDKGPMSSTSVINDVNERSQAQMKSETETDRSKNSSAQLNKTVKDVRQATDDIVSMVRGFSSPAVGSGRTGYSCRDISRDTNSSFQACISDNHTATNLPNDIEPKESGTEEGLREKDISLSLSQIKEGDPDHQSENFSFLPSLGDQFRELDDPPSIPVFSDDMRDARFRLVRSASVNSEQSPTDENKKLVTPTISTNPLLVTEESGRLVSRSQSFASLPKFFKKTKNVRVRRISLPHVSREKPLTCLIVQPLPQYTLQFLGEISNASKIENVPVHVDKDGYKQRKITSPPDAIESERLETGKRNTCTNLSCSLDPEYLQSVWSTIDILPGASGSYVGKSEPSDIDCRAADIDINNTQVKGDSQNEKKVFTDDVSDLPGRKYDRNVTEKCCPQIQIEGRNQNVLYQRQKMEYCNSPSSRSNSSPSIMTPIPREQGVMPRQIPPLETRSAGRDRFLSINSLSSVCQPRLSYNKNHNSTRKSKTIDKTTIVAFAVSIVFVVSFLPYLTLMFVRAFVEDFDYKLQDGTIWLYSFFLRFYLLNSAVNPLLYGWLNERFRAESKRLLCCCQRGKRLTD